MYHDHNMYLIPHRAICGVCGTFYSSGSAHCILVRNSVGFSLPSSFRSTRWWLCGGCGRVWFTVPSPPRPRGWCRIVYVKGGEVFVLVILVRVVLVILVSLEGRVGWCGRGSR